MKNLDASDDNWNRKMKVAKFGYVLILNEKVPVIKVKIHHAAWNNQSEENIEQH